MAFGVWPKDLHGKRHGGEANSKPKACFTFASQLIREGPATVCRSGFLADPDFRRTFARRIHANEDSLADKAVADPSATVPIDVDKLISAPLAPTQWLVSGHIYDVDTGLVSAVFPATTPAHGQPDMQKT